MSNSRIAFLLMNDARPAKTPFRTTAIRSGLVTPRQIARVIELTESEDDELIAATLVRSGVITKYQATQLKAGRSKLTLGPYLITDWIGQGGMGQVFKAVHNVMGRECAVKVLPRDKSTEESRLAFAREIRLQAGLDSPYVVRAFDAGQDGNVHYLVTEYVPGTDLRRLIRNNGPLQMHHAAKIVSQAAMGLQYAHELGLVHRDVKPGNILVTPDGHAKVSDIGMATWSMSPDDDPRAGKIVGTADYLSPEQIRNPRAVGPSSDIYGLGCTLYYAVTGKVPFPGGDSKSKCKRHCEQTPWHPRRFAPDLTEDFVDTIADMMEKDVARRISTAAEIAERLEPWAQSEDEPIHRPLGRQAWMPPPPPNEPQQIEPPPIAVGSESGQTSGALSSGSNITDPSASQVPVPIDAESNSEVSGTQNSPAVPIAIALAIAIPVCILIGAIAGFMLSEMMR